ncbi:ComEA family DNA-binding protein [Maribacter sp. 2307ULW6-5]|uniref:ComEA family DNA-binding protein n=1 Tax=Maribacter sp. 2307ULW6-5 TaxID=3386275 RepID=UPI0039BD6100
MEKFKSHFRFNKQERNGIFYLLLILVLLQLGHYVHDHWARGPAEVFKPDNETQASVDALKERARLADTLRRYPFNPNYVSDYKGYTLGMSVEELDRLHQFREAGRFVNSAAEFQEVTGVGDSLLRALAPLFKFPEWTTSRRSSKKTGEKRATSREALAKRDLNAATAEELKEIHGIGDKLSQRIVKFRERLGGFLVKGQLYETYGLDKEVADRVFERYGLPNPPKIQKLDVNSATAQELAQLVYIDWSLARAIVDYRISNDSIASLDELLRIKDFPSHRIDRIKLYLTAKK